MADNSHYNELSIGRVDWWTVMIYAALVVAGWFNIYAAVYDEGHAGIFSFATNYGKQLIWIGICVFIAVSILLIDDKYYHILAYPLYWAAIAVLVAVLFLGKEVNGSKSWIMIGSIAFQPTEIVKFTTALALARYMSSYTFNIHRLRDIIMAGLIIALPVLMIVLQHDKGSAMVYLAFLIPMFREGFNGWVYVAIIMVIALFLLSFVLEPITLLIALIVVCVVGEALVNRRWRQSVIYLASLALGVIALYGGLNLAGVEISLYASILIAVVVSLVFVLIYAYRRKVRNIALFIALFFGSLAFTFSVDYIFDNWVELHQQKRFLDLLGLESDLQGWGYNVNQSKIAIGSGGFAGKGYLEGTQTKFNFVPEQSTDFIFCTVGEEWGFVGSSIITILFGVLIIKLIKMAERQKEAFGRIYCYSVAAIFFFHVLINIGMTIGIMPVIGIPLPFFSYGGSSLLSFTILLFVAIKLDTSKNEFTQGQIYGAL